MTLTSDGTRKAGQTVAQQTTAASSPPTTTTTTIRSTTTTSTTTTTNTTTNTTTTITTTTTTLTTTAPLPKATTAGASGAGHTAPSPPKAGSATVTATTGSATPSNGSDDKSNGPPDWEALRAEVAKKGPKVQVRQIDNGVALLKFFIENQDESKSTVYRAPPKKDADQDRKKNTPKVPIFK